MKIEIQTIWSPDLNPPSEGLPDDLEDFDILINVSLGELGMTGGEVFQFSVTSPSMLSKAELTTTPKRGGLMVTLKGSVYCHNFNCSIF